MDKTLHSFHHKKHPSELGSGDVKLFLSWLTTHGHVAVNTQKVALNALVFMYHKYLHIELGELGFTLATKQRTLPTVLSKKEVRLILEHLHGTAKLVIQILYSPNERLGCELAVKHGRC
ncbi:phage integrase N-terminal SAM-like domain-containing protein [Shewanella violacea]|uniref:Integrase SAM-like N-terminal domain-containing protein n=1 Tax=Shewanella violacea (strain JCM 10179 / CIP 106290 / LMG 19151 / DSS12) TaxID=637905 RepID=D4ZLR9_SHEVD|nr:phage integrase N-terminal SAM-like domain-containing protein [Shewanella violacea]BAJ02618.1 hypothetical protein SVI_2647 [Shewanella violacea DSS12]